MAFDHNLPSSGIFSLHQDGSLAREFAPFNESLSAQFLAETINSGKFSPQEAYLELFSYKERPEIWGLDSQQPPSVGWTGLLPAWRRSLIQAAPMISPSNSVELFNLGTASFEKWADRPVDDPEKISGNPFLTDFHFWCLYLGRSAVEDSLRAQVTNFIRLKEDLTLQDKIYALGSEASRASIDELGHLLAWNPVGHYIATGYPEDFYVTWSQAILGVLFSCGSQYARELGEDWLSFPYSFKELNKLYSEHPMLGSIRSHELESEIEKNKHQIEASFKDWRSLNRQDPAKSSHPEFSPWWMRSSDGSPLQGSLPFPILAKYFMYDLSRIAQEELGPGYFTQERFATKEYFALPQYGLARFYEFMHPQNVWGNLHRTFPWIIHDSLKPYGFFPSKRRLIVDD